MTVRMVDADAVIAAIRNDNCPCNNDQSKCRGCLIDDAIDVIGQMAKRRIGATLLGDDENE